MNNSFEKSKVVNKRNDDSVETPIETESERLSTDNHLQLEYRQIKERITQMNVKEQSIKKSMSPSPK